MEESCNIKYGYAAVAEVRLKYNELPNQLNKADLIKSAKGRLITDENLSFYHEFGDNETKKSHVTSDVVDLVCSSDELYICSSGSNHQILY